jgi:hypothetical protein
MPESTGTRPEGQISSYFRVSLPSADLPNQTKRNRIACINTTEGIVPLFSNSPICLPTSIAQTPAADPLPTSNLVPSLAPTWAGDDVAGDRPPATTR